MCRSGLPVESGDDRAICIYSVAELVWVSSLLAGKDTSNSTAP